MSPLVQAVLAAAAVLAWAALLAFVCVQIWGLSVIRRDMRGYQSRRLTRTRKERENRSDAK